VALFDGVGGPAEQQLSHFSPAGQPPDAAAPGTARLSYLMVAHDLAKDEPGLFLGDLAISLASLGDRLSGVGR